MTPVDPIPWRPLSPTRLTVEVPTIDESSDSEGAYPEYEVFSDDGVSEPGTSLDVCTCGQVTASRDDEHSAAHSEGAAVAAGTVVVGAGAGAGALAAPVVAQGALGLVGFGTQGVVGGTYDVCSITTSPARPELQTFCAVIPGSIAAWIQASIGNVAAGSLFSVCQSVGATGAIGLAGTALGAATGGLTVAGVGMGVYRLVKAAQDRESQARERRLLVETLCSTCGKRKMQ